MVALERIDAEPAFLRLLINQLRPSVRSSPNSLVKLLGHIAGLVSGYAVVMTPEGRMIGQGGIPSIFFQAYRSEAAEKVRDGQLSAASLVRNDFYLQIVGIGEFKPRPLILVARRTQYPTWMANLVNYAAVALTASSTLSRVERVEQQLAQAMQAAKVAVLTHLMAGNVDAARRLAERVVPGVLEPPLARVFVIECPHSARACILETCQRSLGGSALAAADPHRDDRVVIVAPTAQSPHLDGVRSAIKALAVAHANCVVGESGPAQLDRIGEAHEMAVRALRVGRRQPDRMALYSEERQLAHILADTSWPWAQAYVKPLHELRELERGELLAVARQVLQFGHGGAAKRIGLNRKTVGVRWNRIAAILGLDLGDMRVRAELNLALDLIQNERGGADSAPSLSLTEILLHPVARTWAQKFLAPLRRDSRPLLRTVEAWVGANGRIHETAVRLQAHPNTVRNHLAACERLLGRRLVGRSGGANDLVMALRILEQEACAAQDPAAVEGRWLPDQQHDPQRCFGA